jgi:hypothetical protein
VERPVKLQRKKGKKEVCDKTGVEAKQPNKVGLGE